MNVLPSPLSPDLSAVLALPSAMAIAPSLRQRLVQASTVVPGPGVTAVAALDPAPVVAALLESLSLLGADSDTVAAAILHTYPSLTARLGPSLEHDFPAVAALLDGQRAAEQDWALHAEPGGRTGSEG